MPLLNRILLALALHFACVCHAAGQPKRVIFETDLQGDCDDVGALATLHALADFGQAEIVAVMINSAGPHAPACADAVNTFFGRPDIPIGALKNPPETLRSNADRYAPVLARTYPNDLFSDDPETLAGNVPDATALYRKLLAQQPDQSVTILSVGFHGNLARLLDSKPDEHSPLTGVELVAAKVEKLVVMAKFDGYDSTNIARDAASARRVMERWPTPVMFSDLGRNVITGPDLPRDTAEDHIVRRAYELHTDNRRNKGELRRSSWDQAAVLYAVWGDGAYFTEVPYGSFTVTKGDAYVHWAATPDRRQGFIRQSIGDTHLARVIGDLMSRPGKNADRGSADWGAIRIKLVDECDNCIVCSEGHHADARPMQDRMFRVTLENDRVRVVYAPNLHDGGMTSYFWKDHDFEFAGGDYQRLDFGDCRYQPTFARVVNDGEHEKTVYIEWGHNYETMGEVPIASEVTIFRDSPKIRISYLKPGWIVADKTVEKRTREGAFAIHSGAEWFTKKGWPYPPTTEILNSKTYSNPTYSREGWRPQSGEYDAANGGELAYKGHFIMGTFNKNSGIGVGRVIPVKNAHTWKLLYEPTPLGFEYRAKGAFDSYLYPTAAGADGLKR